MEKLSVDSQLVLTEREKSSSDVFRKIIHRFVIVQRIVFFLAAGMMYHIYIARRYGESFDQAVSGFI